MAQVSGSGGDTASFDVVAIASSAGGIQALTEVLGALPTDFPVPVVLVQHLDSRHPSVLDQVLKRRCTLAVKIAESGDVIAPGTVYVAAPGRHLVISSDAVLSLTGGEPVHFVRPSADVLFTSIAKAFEERAIVCILTGTGRDGARGAAEVKARGGTVIVQDPDTAQFAGMPRAAIATGAVDYVVKLEAIAVEVRGLVEGRLR